jgi:hypothetical protein
VPLLGKNAKVIVIGEEPAPGAAAKGTTFGVSHHSDDLLREARDLRARGMEAEGQRVLDDELERLQAGTNRSAEAHVLRNQGNFAQDRGRYRQRSSSTNSVPIHRSRQTKYSPEFPRKRS